MRGHPRVQASAFRAALADPAATPDLRDLATRVAAGRVLTAGQEAHAWRLITAAGLFNEWAHERQDLLPSLQPALNDPAADPVLRDLALQVTYGTSRLGPRPLSRRQEALAREILSEMQARRPTVRQPGGDARSRPASRRAGRPRRRCRRLA